MIQFQVQVFMNENTMKSNHRLFERIIPVADIKVVEFHSIIRALSFLFGSQSIISFNLKTL